MNHEKELREALENLIEAYKTALECEIIEAAIDHAKEVLNKSKTI